MTSESPPDLVFTLIREAISALKDQALSPEEASALFRGLAEALRAVVDLLPNFWAKAIIRVAAQICDEAADGMERKHGID